MPEPQLVWGADAPGGLRDHGHHNQVIMTYHDFLCLFLGIISGLLLQRGPVVANVYTMVSLFSSTMIMMQPFMPLMDCQDYACL